VQYNDGFKTGLIGTPETVAKRIIELKQLGMGMILCGFLHYNWELKNFGEKVIPLVREMEADLRKGRRVKKKSA
jgi:FMNH2-dependent dimethyl sulfone monooxygenase